MVMVREGGSAPPIWWLAVRSVAVLTPHCVSVRPYLRTAYSLAWRVSIDATVLVQDQDHSRQPAWGRCSGDGAAATTIRIPKALTMG